MRDSKIEWTDHTANLWWGCEKVGEGCVNCYAANLANRWGKDLWGVEYREAKKAVWNDLKKWESQAKSEGRFHRVFVGSMMDIFEKSKPMVDHQSNYLFKEDHSDLTSRNLRDRFFIDVVPESPHLMFLLLTKRPSNINKYIPLFWTKKQPRNVMYGVTVANNSDAQVAARALSKVEGKTFWSAEPLLEELNLEDVFNIHKPDWVICGGESGHSKRPFKKEWAVKLMNDCRAHGIPFFMKQIDKVEPVPEYLMVRELPDWFNFNN